MISINFLLDVAVVGKVVIVMNAFLMQVAATGPVINQESAYVMKAGEVFSVTKVS